MGVPNNFSYTLRNVVDEIPGVQTSLKDCFDVADNGLFDTEWGGPSYSGEGTGFDRLRNFRNYGDHIESRSVTIRPFLSCISNKNLYGEGTAEVGWGDIRNCTVDWNFSVPDPTAVHIKRTYTGFMTIGRAYLGFNLNDLTGEAVSVELHIRRNSSIGVGHGFEILRASWVDPLATTDSCSGIAQLLSGSDSVYQQADSSYVYKIVSSAGDLTAFNANVMDAFTGTVLVHDYDYNNTLPDLGDEFKYVFYQGAEISQSLVWNAELRINYTGNPFLNAYAPLHGNWENIIISTAATVERVFISADDITDWKVTIDDSPVWISILDPSTGSGSYKIDVSITENTTYFERDATIRIGSDVHTDSRIHVHQDGIRLTATPSTWYAPIDGYEIITVEANSTNNWNTTVTLGGAWLSIFAGGSGTGDGYFSLHVTGGGHGQGEVTISSDAADFIINVIST